MLDKETLRNSVRACLWGEDLREVADLCSPKGRRVIDRIIVAVKPTSVGDEIDAMLAGEEKMIVAFCPECGGWTMFCTSTSENARDRIRHSYVAGDLVMVVRSPAGMGPACPTSWDTGKRCGEE